MKSIVALFLFVGFLACKTPCSDCPPEPHLKVAWNASIEVFDADQDHCVTSDADIAKKDRLIALVGASMFNLYRVVNGGCSE